MWVSRLRAGTHPKSSNPKCELLLHETEVWWTIKKCDQPESHLNRKQCATVTGLQTRYQLPVQSCMSQVKTETKERREGKENFSFTVKKGSLGVFRSSCQNRGKKERKEPHLVSLPPNQHSFSGCEKQQNDWTVLHHPLTCWSQWGHLWSDVCFSFAPWNFIVKSSVLFFAINWYYLWIGL